MPQPELEEQAESSPPPYVGSMNVGPIARKYLAKMTRKKGG